MLLFIADSASHDEKYDKAHEYIDKAKELFPEDTRVYQSSALLWMKEKQYEKAMAQVEEGIKKVSGAKATELLIFKEELQLQAADVKGARQTIEDLQKNRNLRPEVFDYFEARTQLVEGKWFEASEALNKLRPKIGDFGRDRVMEVDFSLGLCYERLGRLDLAQDQYELVLQTDPQNEPAQSGLQRVRNQMGVDSKGQKWRRSMEQGYRGRNEEAERSAGYRQAQQDAGGHCEEAQLGSRDGQVDQGSNRNDARGLRRGRQAAGRGEPSIAEKFGGDESR